MKRYVYAKVLNEENGRPLYAILDYIRDELLRWTTNEKAAKDITKALNESEDTYEMSIV